MAETNTTVIILQLKRKKERKKERKKRKQAKNKTNKPTNEQVWDAKEKKSVCGPTLATSALSNSHRVL